MPEMSITQVAILLQISGFVIATVFAAILLERGTVGGLADKLYTSLHSATEDLKTSFPPPPPKAIKGAIWYAFFSVLLLTAIAAILIGWLRNDKAAIAGGLLYAFGFLIPALAMIIRSKDRRQTLKRVAKELIVLLLVTPALILTGIILFGRLIMIWLIGKDMLKKVFIVFGSLLILLGLILEFVDTF
jgi:hypothetical protein